MVDRDYEGLRKAGVPEEWARGDRADFHRSRWRLPPTVTSIIAGRAGASLGRLGVETLTAFAAPLLALLGGEAFILSLNIARCHLNKVQIAVVDAKAYPDAEHGGARAASGSSLWFLNTSRWSTLAPYRRRAQSSPMRRNCAGAP
jgi:hypothetical protein